MPPRPCLDCGTPCHAPRCPACTSRRRSTLYGVDHVADRAAWAPLVAAGTVSCCACLRPIAPDAPWHLAHRGSRPSAPAHEQCNYDLRVL